MLFDVIDARRAWALLQAGFQSGELIAASHRQHFDAAIGVVAHPAGDTEDVRLALHKPAKSYTLDASAHQEAASLRNGLCCRDHVYKLQKLEVKMQK